MLQQIAHTVIAYLHLHPHSAGIIAFCVAFAESMAIIGTIIPGSFTMTAVGVLIGSRVIPAYSTLLWAMGGAISGDLISYLIGVYYQDRLHKIWPFSRYPEWTEKGEKFFAKHGGKSVVIGRFFGPMRPMVPLIAGSLKMRTSSFLLAAIPSACAWAICYMLPGILLGALSLELPPGIAIEFIIVVLLIIGVGVVITWLTKYIISHFAAKVDHFSYIVWEYLQTHKKSRWITKLLTSKYQPENHGQLILLVYAVICVILFFVVFINVIINGPLTWLNSPILHLLRSIHTNKGDNINIIITIFANKYTMLVSAAVILLWFVVNKKWRIAIHWAAVVISCGGAVEFFKLIYFSPRPDMPNPWYTLSTSSSFPSGHSLLAITLIGYLAVLFAQQLDKEQKKIPYIIAIIISVLVSFSRLYLGAHWLTDVLGSLFLGLTIILVVTMSYRRHAIEKLSIGKNLTVIALIFILAWTLNSMHRFHRNKREFALTWPVKIISLHNWTHKKTEFMPRFRANRLGHPIEAFNIEWLGSLNNIQQTLIKHGWQYHDPKLTPKSLVHRLASKKTSHLLPLLPQTYLQKSPVLILTKDINSVNRSVVLRLWASKIKIKNSRASLWLGAINYYKPPHKLLTSVESKMYKKRFFGAISILVPFLQNYYWEVKYLPKDQQPDIMQKLDWDGRIILIMDKK